MNIKRFHIEWSNNLRFKDEIDPFYINPTNFREVVSIGKTISWEYELEDGTIIKGREENK